MSLSSFAIPLEPPQILEYWAERVRANRDQVNRLREVPDGADFYAPVAQHFRADPRRTDDPVLDYLRGLARPGQTWVDIGSGAGRYALPLALAAQPGGTVIAVDPSERMLNVLQQDMVETGIPNVQPVSGRWPERAASDTIGDLALISHLGYDVEEIGPFLDAMEDSARVTCVAVLLQRPAPHPFDQLWPAVHGEPRAALPALPDLLQLLLARRQVFEVKLFEVIRQTYDDVDAALTAARRQLWTLPNSPKDQRLQAVLRERLVERDGRLALNWDPAWLGVASWPTGDRTAHSRV